ncbi:hypothetical protein H8D64_00110 [PVC group bacterium]|nr:hypothetical protein [PVC group bacterium]
MGRILSFWLSALILSLILVPDSLIAKDERLEKAWKEYRFQAYATAEMLFEDVKESAVDKKDKQEAKVGLAMILQFDQKQMKFAKAIEIYESLIDEGVDGDAGILVKSLLAESKAAIGDIDSANALWDEVISNNPSSIVAHDALLRRTMVNMKSYDTTSTHKTMGYLNEKREKFPEPSRKIPSLAPTIERVMAEYFFWNEEYEKSMEYFLNYISVGMADTIGYGKRARALYRVARMYETIFNDTVSAGKYYRLLALETPSDQRSYYGIEKAAKYGTITADELRKMKFSGLTEEIIQELFSTKKKATSQ